MVKHSGLGNNAQNRTDTPYMNCPSERSEESHSLYSLGTSERNDNSFQNEKQAYNTLLFAAKHIRQVCLIAIFILKGIYYFYCSIFVKKIIKLNKTELLCGEKYLSFRLY